jgi:hypothetical protein
MVDARALEHERNDGREERKCSEGAADDCGDALRAVRVREL